MIIVPSIACRSSVNHVLWLNGTWQRIGHVSIEYVDDDYLQAVNNKHASISSVVRPQFWMKSCCLQPITHVRRITYLSVNWSVRYSSVTKAYMGLYSLCEIALFPRSKVWRCLQIDGTVDNSASQCLKRLYISSKIFSFRKVSGKLKGVYMQYIKNAEL